MYWNRIAILAATLTLGVACSNGGGNQVPGNQCPSDYQPIDPNPAPAGKVSLKPDAGGHLNLKSGNYKYQGADLFYEDAEDAPAKNYRVHIQDKWDDKLKVFSANVACARNAKPGMGLKEIGMSTQGLTNLSVDRNQKLGGDDLAAKTYGFEFLADGQMRLSFAPTAQKPSDPSGIYGAESNGYIFVHPENPDLIEVRSEGKTRNGGHWTLRNTFVRTDAK